MKKYRACFVALLLFGVLCGCGAGANTPGEIKFPQTTQELNEKTPFYFELEDQKDRMGDKLPLYRIAPRRTSKNASYYDGCLFKVFTGNINHISENDRFTKYDCNDGDTLEIYDNGCFIFNHNRSGTDTVNMSDDEIIALAEEYLKSNALLPDDFFVGKSLGGTYRDDGTPCMKSVGFYREIDGYEVCGRSDIIVEVDSDGIKAIYSIYSDYEFDRDVRCLSYEDVMEIDPLTEGQIVFDATQLKGEVEKVVIQDLKIMYYDSPVNQPELAYIQPVYQFQGLAVDSEGNSTDLYWTIAATKHNSKSKSI